VEHFYGNQEASARWEYAANKYQGGNITDVPRDFNTEPFKAWMKANLNGGTGPTNTMDMPRKNFAQRMQASVEEFFRVVFKYGPWVIVGGVVITGVVLLMPAVPGAIRGVKETKKELTGEEPEKPTTEKATA